MSTRPCTERPSGARPGCPCGSGKPSHWQFDARGIELCRTCEDCHERKMAGYRPEVLTDSNYEASEDIEPDEPVHHFGDENTWGDWEKE